MLGFLAVVGMVLFSSAIYYIEKAGCPRVDKLEPSVTSLLVQGVGRSVVGRFRCEGVL